MPSHSVIFNKMRDRVINIEVPNAYFENVVKFKCLKTAVKEFR